MMEIKELFNLLESNQPQSVEEIKKKFHENFNATKEPWILNGLFDYFVQTSSIRTVEIIVSVREPHDKFLFERIDEALRQPIKLQALTLLGHVVRRQPPWIYKIINHHGLFKTLLKLLKTETEILPLMSALFILIILLPMIPAYIGPYLSDIFGIFSRLAAWNCNNSGKLTEEQLVHLQIGMYALFLKLYGMYPCNFLYHLQQEYGTNRENFTIFSHTIKPMIDTLKMHPFLVTSSKEAEVSTNRWKKMGHHDVIVECARFSLDPIERSREDPLPGLTNSFRGRSNIKSSAGPSIISLSNSTTPHLSTLTPTPVSSLASMENDHFSPTLFFEHSKSPPAPEIGIASVPQTPITASSTPQAIVTSSVYASQEGTSPPEAAVEATPETTPIKDLRFSNKSAVPSHSNVVRALTTLNPSKWNEIGVGTSQSQPSSPMRKEISSAFRFPTDSNSAFELLKKDKPSFVGEDPKIDSFTKQRLSRLMRDRINVNENVHVDRNARSKTPQNYPTSPLRVISSELSVPNSPVPIDVSDPTSGGKDWHVAKPKPEKNGFCFESSSTNQDVSQEDQEIEEIVRQSEQFGQNEHFRQSEQSNLVYAPFWRNVMPEYGPSHNEEFEECDQHSGSPCTSGGLHMPNSQSMRNFRKHINRLRCYSQTVTDSSETDFFDGINTNEKNQQSNKMMVRRAKSCPNIEKANNIFSKDITSIRALNETDEININSIHASINVNGSVALGSKQLKNTACQTVYAWPQPYEHLFLEIFAMPNDVRSTASSEHTYTSSPANTQCSLPVRLSPYQMLDKYLELTKGRNDRDKRAKQLNENEVKMLREQLELVHLQLQFERHRRDVYAERNRSLASKVKSNRAIEECNNALRDQLVLLEKDIETLRNQFETKEKNVSYVEKKLQDDVEYWTSQCNKLQEENRVLKSNNEILERHLSESSTKIENLNTGYHKSEATLFDLRNQMHFALKEAAAGEQTRSDLEQLQKELLLIGELVLKYQDKLASLTNLKCREEEMEYMSESYSFELEGVNQQLTHRNSSLESAKARIVDLENTIAKNEELCTEQKKILKVVKEEYQVELNAVESKYNTQRKIIKAMEEQLLLLQGQIDKYEYASRKEVQSPESHSSGRDIGSAERIGVSPHSSPPLSVSLTSSEGGSMAFLQTNTSGTLINDVEMKNLQVIVDQPQVPNLTNENPDVSDKPSTSQSNSSTDFT